MFLVRLALNNIYLVVVLALMIVVIGTVALTAIPVDILPVFKAPAVQVLTYFNGMPTRSIERTITDRIERWVNQAPGVREVESRSVVGVSVVKLYFQDDIDPNTAMTMSSSLAMAARPYLPTNTLPPVLLPFDPTGTLPLGILTVSNPTLTEAGVKDLARVQVRNMLGAVKGCVAPVVVGGKDRRVMIYLDPKALEARGLAPVDVVRALDEGNLMVSPGTAYFGDNAVALDSNMMVRQVEELNDLPIRVGGAQQVLLRDVGHAEDSSVIQKSRVRINGRQQVFVPIYRQAGASSLAVADNLREALPQMQKELPEGSTLSYVIDQTNYVRSAIDSLLHEGAIGAVLVGVMILVFLGNWRLTLIAVMTLPLAILCGVVGLSATGNTINVMTLAGLFLAIGPLVDNAIVVLENTHRHHHLGKHPMRAAFDGATELTLPVLVATGSTVIVLTPIALMPGLGGFLFKPLALAVAFAMIASFGLSWTFVPSLCAHWLKPHGAGGHDDARRGLWARAHGKFEAGLGALNRGYLWLLDRALARRGPVLAGVAVLFLASLTLLWGIGREFFPQVDAGQITIHVRAPSNLRLDATERRILTVEQVIDDQVPGAERAMVVSEIGVNNDWSSAYTPNAGQHDAVIRVQLTDQRTLSAQDYAITLRRAFEKDTRLYDLHFSFDTGGIVSTALNYGASSPIDVQIGGPPDKAMALAQAVRQRLAAIPGTADVRVLQRNDAPYMLVNVNRQKAAAVGLTAREVVMQVVTAMNSSIAMTRNFWIDPRSGNQYFVAVQYPEDPDFRLEDLENVFATGTKQGTPVRLSSLVEITQTTGAVELNHVGLRRVVNVLVNTENRDVGSVAGDVQRALRDVPNPDGLPIDLKGEYARMNESFQSLGFGLVLAAVLVYLLLVPLLRSFVGPFIIMFAVPLGLIGVLATLFLTRTTLNVQSAMGVIFLVGIVVSNAVLLLDFANKQLAAGLSVRDAVVRAAAIRFRPILMTFLATFLDLLPLAIGLGKGGTAITPLARAVVGGLLTSTFLTLIVVPVLYTLLIRPRREPPPDLDAVLAAPAAP
jgi:multidrug efflux pump subunit AcrB